MYDVIIIGGGVIGCAAARELTRYRYREGNPLKVCVLEKGEDVCCGTSKANSGIVHSGIDAQHGTLKAELNVEGSKRMEQLSEELDFSYRKNGSLITAFDEADIPKLEELCENGRKNGVPGVEVISGDKARMIEPCLSGGVVAAAYAPSGGIVCPFGLTAAFAENAAVNGAEFLFQTEAIQIRKGADGVDVTVRQQDRWDAAEISVKTIRGRYLVNAAGIHSDDIHNMLSSGKIKIQPRKGEYLLFDRSEGSFADKTIFQLPTKYGKGVLVTPTVHGNLLVGPTAVDIEDKDGIQTTQAGLAEVMEKASQSVGRLPGRKIITSFTGLRAHTDRDDFILGEISDAPGCFDAAGIESPGLTAAPAAGARLAVMIAEKCGAVEREDFISRRKGILNPAAMDTAERNSLIQKEPAYGNIICRCEMISEGEILDAIRRPLGAKSLDALKRRVRVGAGRCQAGFCSPKVLELLAEELGVDWTKITKNGGASGILTGKTKE